jgi:hypothetical protein
MQNQLDQFGFRKREIRASEAKTHFPQFLDDVQRGETIVITRRGRAQVKRDKSLRLEIRSAKPRKLSSENV